MPDEFGMYSHKEVRTIKNNLLNIMVVVQNVIDELSRDGTCGVCGQPIFYPPEPDEENRDGCSDECPRNWLIAAMESND